jgi:hypothetical protein
MPSVVASHPSDADIEMQLRSIMEEHAAAVARSPVEHADSPGSTPTVHSVHDQPFSAITTAMSDTSSSPQPMQSSETHSELHAHHGWPIAPAGPAGPVMLAGPAPTPSISGATGPVSAAV